MNEVFNSGFNDRSFFYLAKKIAEGLYDFGINVPTNPNKKYNSEIKFDYYFVNNDTMNASVSHKNNIDYLYMNVGTMRIIYTYFYNIFAQSNTFDNIGIPLEEINKKINGGFDFKEKQLLFDGMPKCNDRRTIAELVSLFAVRYLSCHELGHLLNGHVFYLKEKTGSFEMAMAMGNENNGLTPLNRRTLEMDADAFAASQGIINIIEIFKQKKEFDFFMDIIKNPIILFELWAFAIHSLFLLFEKFYGPVEYSVIGLYLPFEARETLNLSSANSALNYHCKKGYFEYGKYNSKDINKSLNIGIEKAEKYFNEFFKTKYNFYTSIQNNPDYTKFADEVLDNWYNIKKDLAKYSRTILYGDFK